MAARGWACAGRVGCAWLAASGCEWLGACGGLSGWARAVSCVRLPKYGWVRVAGDRGRGRVGMVSDLEVG